MAVCIIRNDPDLRAGDRDRHLGDRSNRTSIQQRIAERRAREAQTWGGETRNTERGTERESLDHAIVELLGFRGALH